MNAEVQNANFGVYTVRPSRRALPYILELGEGMSGLTFAQASHRTIPTRMCKFGESRNSFS